MRIDIATLFPEMCETFLRESIIGRAQKNGHIEAHCHQIREYTTNRQKQVDDYPYGGGCGMVMQAQPIYDCCMDVIQKVQAAGHARPHIIFMTAAGQKLTEEKCKQLAQMDSLLLVCGHYEGMDERVIEALADEEISIGDYVLTGGELPALVLADSVFRLCDGVLSSPEGYEEESHYGGLLEYPQYSRPEVWEGRGVPEVLLSGHHANIAAWRHEQALARTRARRPDMAAAYDALHPPVPPKKKKVHRKPHASAQKTEETAETFTQTAKADAADISEATAKSAEKQT